MAINLSSERAISLALARHRLLPKPQGRVISSTTAYRWVKQGVAAGDGQRVRLEAVRVGRSLMTTEQAVNRFLNELARRAVTTSQATSSLVEDKATSQRYGDIDRQR